MHIYLDLNVYLQIAKKQNNYEYLIAKINNLKKQGFVFPHAPPHAEELANRENNRSTNNVLFLIDKFNKNTGYIPGDQSKEQIETFLNFIDRSNPDLEKIIRKLEKSLLEIDKCNLYLSYNTKIIQENFIECLDRVKNDMDATNFAKNNDILNMGRRNPGRLRCNYTNLGLEQLIDSTKTFCELRKKYKLDTKKLAQIAPEEIFSDKNFLEFIKAYSINKYGYDYEDLIKKGNLSNFHFKQCALTLILDALEIAGYNQEKKNHEASITGRMHNVSHAIYASSADFFITNDQRFRYKTKAAYSELKINTKVLCINEFINYQF